jgi:hypothetical protein
MVTPNQVCDVLYLGIRKFILRYKVLLWVQQFVWWIRNVIGGTTIYLGYGNVYGGTAIYMRI